MQNFAFPLHATFILHRMQLRRALKFFHFIPPREVFKTSSTFEKALSSGASCAQMPSSRVTKAIANTSCSIGRLDQRIEQNTRELCQCFLCSTGNHLLVIIQQPFTFSLEVWYSRRTRATGRENVSLIKPMKTMNIFSNNIGMVIVKSVLGA